MVKPIRKSTSKNPPILSHEFIIQNHADIVSCVAMLFVIGIMVQATSPFASIFITMQHNVTQLREIPLYQPGARDWCAVFFYSLICIIIHAILQEYVLDKVSKRLHLSKSKLVTFSTSGQLATFYLMSTVWGMDVMVKEHYLPDISLLWSDYPAPMSFMLKLFMVIQLAYYLHELPELYFQRNKREEYLGKIVSSLVKMVAIYIPYFLGFNRLMVCLLVFHYMSEVMNHSLLLVQTIDKDEKFTRIAGVTSNSILILSRLLSIIVSVLTLWYGLALSGKETINIEEGYFNVAPVRLSLLAAICLFQAYLMFNFVSQQLSKVRESKDPQSATNKSIKNKKEKPKKGKKVKEESDLPEVDQNTNKNLRKQKTK